MVHVFMAYPMNLFKFPATICKELDSLVMNFWSGHDKDERHIHWVFMETLRLPKARKGGSVS